MIWSAAARARRQLSLAAALFVMRGDPIPLSLVARCTNAGVNIAAIEERHAQ